MVKTFLSAALGPTEPILDLGTLGRLDISLLLGSLVALILAVALYEVRGYGAGSDGSLALAAVLSAVLVYGVTSCLSGGSALRYAAAATMLLVSALALAAPRMPRGLQFTAAALLAVVALMGFSASDSRLSGPSWQHEVTKYQESCLIDGDPTPIGLSPAGWGQIRLDCPR